MDEIVIGYDERAPRAKELSDEFLIKPVEFVRSVDRHVWPSLRKEMSFSIVEPSSESIAVAITFVPSSNLDPKHLSYFRSLNEACLPPSLPGDSVFLGYDVCGLTLVSGLLNCAYSGNEQALYAERWASKLNSAHLFASQQDALAFGSKTSERVSEHAPFFVFGVYKCGRP